MTAGFEKLDSMKFIAEREGLAAASGLHLPPPLP
jgi:hypothetical protein